MKVFVIVRVNTLQFDETLFPLIIEMIRILQAIPTNEGSEFRMKYILTTFDYFQATNGF